LLDLLSFKLKGPLLNGSSNDSILNLFSFFYFYFLGPRLFLFFIFLDAGLIIFVFFFSDSLEPTFFLPDLVFLVFYF